MKNLSIENSLKLIGKTIEWEAPGYAANGNYSGTAVITGVNPAYHRPITSDTLTGDPLGLAFNDGWKTLAYSDSGRYITYKVIS